MVLPHNLRSPVDISNPQWVGVCDRCAALVYYASMTWQQQWRGNTLVKLGILVCDTCVDVPSEFLRPAIVGPEGIGPQPPRPTAYYVQNLGGTPAPTFEQIVDGD